jgi:methionyl-tRNA formyltransferase
VAERARELGLELEQPASVNTDEARERIAAAEPEVLVVCAFGALIKEPLLSDHEILNVHPSLLPRWRGAAPVERAIMAGDEVTGVSIMRLVADLDAGPVCAVEAEAVRGTDTYGTLAPRLQELGAKLLIRALDEHPHFVEQDHHLVTYADKIGPEDRTLDLSRPAIDNERIVRALTPHIGARIALPDGSFLGVRTARAHDDGRLELLEVQPAGGRPMPYADYLRGHEPVPGAR